LILVEVEVVDKTDNTIRLIVRGVDVSFMNTLRRLILTEVPSMAVDDVVIFENSSVLNDEVLAHRLGFIPLTTDLDSYNLPEECPCKSEFGCNLCRVALTLNVEAADGIKTVYSGDFVSENPDVKPVSDRIPIVKLAQNQKLKLEAYARLGQGRVHAKWQPVSMCAYKFFPQIKIDGKRCDACEDCVKVCPKSVFVKVGNKIEVRNVIDCTLCEDCVDACLKDPSAVELTWDKNSFIFDSESTGALPVERLVTEAFSFLDKKFKSFLKKLKKVK
jgi:DNA-directed RNA polymerase subunit D